ncbi:ATP-binding protein [Nonomuraea sp. NPDC049709]|uniref:YifB family Mg chelatase-like AAA ATPase n=1 Tax=Nonomuraea sp. NPDC049709 TaxID=3154736 RepID=UPI003446626A
MGFAATSSAVVIGLSGYVVRIEADLSPGQPGFHLLGLPEATAACTRDRVRAAILNSGYTWPDRRITVTVLPIGTPVYGAALDVAIAVAILAADGTIPIERLEHTAFLGELGLDGSIRHVRGLPCALQALVTSGIRCVAIPAGNATDGARCALLPAATLADLVGHLNRGIPAIAPSPQVQDMPPILDLADLPGNHAARHALEISAAGGHHLLLIGDGPATMLAERLPGILPDLTEATVDEVAEIHALTETPRRNWRPPLCAPHYTNTTAAIFGRRSGGRIRPGAVSLAHAGVLFLDQAPEFARSILHGLRRPLENGEILLADWEGIVRLPARFQLLLATSPCPCGGIGSCRCGPVERRHYLARLAALRDRIEITAPIHPLDRTAEPGEPGESSATVADRVAAARARTAHRLTGTPWRTNAEVPARELRTCHRLHPEAVDLLEDRLRAGAITPSTLTCLLRLSWTLADLREAARPSRDDAQRALRLWQGEPA